MMYHQMFKIYKQEDFDRITRGIKVARCMRSKSSVSETERVLNQLDDLVVSDSLSCSFCNAMFEDQAQQRLHYKLDWHRYNLKQRLSGLKTISEDGFTLLADKDDVSSISGTEFESENEDETGTSETGGSPSGHTGSNKAKSKSNPITIDDKNKKHERRKKTVDSISDSSDIEFDEETLRKKRMQDLLVVASRHSKVFFENDEGNIFSIYRCLLHSKKEIPEVDNEMIAQALNSGKKTMWTVIMLGGGHFAAAVFEDGEAVVHKTFHCYTVRAKQGGTQSSRDNRTMGSHPKSAGATLRRYNEAALVQHVQEILEAWSTHIANSSLILYRAVGPHNRTVLFGGKTAALDKSDPRLRPLPFPTRRATFSEVKRVYDILTTIEIYGSAADFTDSFPISPRQPFRKKISKLDLLTEIPVKGVIVKNSSGSMSNTCSPVHGAEKLTISSQIIPERQHRCSRAHIDRAKPRKSPRRPLPDIVARLAQSSSESESDVKEGSIAFMADIPLIEQDTVTDFNDHLQAFQNSVPRYMRNKKTRRQKRKVKKDNSSVNEVLTNVKHKLWTACKLGDIELLSSAMESVLAEIHRCQVLEERISKGDEQSIDCICLVNMDNVVQLVNDTNGDGNTMLHLAAAGGHLRLVWTLLEIGSDPCNKNKKLQTPYTATTDKETRNTFRRFMGANPDKFNYNKSQIPGPLTEEMEQEKLEKKKQQKKVKREKEKIKKKEFEIKKQEGEARQQFLNLSDREKRALAAERRILQQGGTIASRCFQCGSNMLGQMPFEYNSNRFCSMPCLKEHRLHNKGIL